ncbi:SCE41.17, hypothetical protein [Actinobacteria bacterium OK074]|nr:SCE41.17, hypothetical protein [Actinobacteria bacterium OK074]
MGIFDRFKDQAKDKGKDLSDAAERAINKKTGDKYTDQVDQVQQQAEKRLGMNRDQDEGS